MLVVLRPGSAVLQLGHAAALLSAVGGSLGSIIVRKIGADERPVVLMLFPMLGNFLVMGSALAFVYQPMPIAHIGMLAVISHLAFVAGLLVIARLQGGRGGDRRTDAIQPDPLGDGLWHAVL